MMTKRTPLRVPSLALILVFPSLVFANAGARKTSQDDVSNIVQETEICKAGDCRTEITHRLRCQDGEDDGDEEDVIEPVFNISFKIEADGLKSSGNFTVANHSHGNYTSSGEKVLIDPGQPIATRNFGSIVFCQPVAHPKAPAQVRMRCAFEIFGPPPSDKTGDALSFVRFQVQTTFEARIGRKTIVVNEPKRRVEFELTELKP